MMPRRVTIIGASGFVGRYVVKRLAAEGAVILACSRRAAAAGFLRPMGDVGQIAAINLDIADERAVAAAVAGAEAVVNAVGILFERGTQRFEEIHHQGPARLARLAAAAGVRHFVHVSAISADASAPALYARTKAAGEAAVPASTGAAGSRQAPPDATADGIGNGHAPTSPARPAAGVPEPRPGHNGGETGNDAR